LTSLILQNKTHISWATVY
jgi:hypothetical protein